MYVRTYVQYMHHNVNTDEVIIYTYKDTVGFIQKVAFIS